MNGICVFTGSSPGRLPAYGEAARELGAAVAARGCTLLYGGANVGLMGVVADAALEAGGEVVGVLPSSLVKHEVAHDRLTELHLADSMHERKAVLAKRSDAFVALPGGYGTIDEVFEMLTWAQLGFHEKPVALLNTEGYYDALLTFIDRAVDDRFLAAAQRDALIVETSVPALLDALEAFKPTYIEKWLDRDGGTARP